MITIQNIVKTFPGIVALNSISMEIKEREFFGLLGPNGAGKSTLMNLLAGYDNPDSGRITIRGEKTGRDNLAIRKQIGLIPQSLALYDDLSAEDNLEIFGSLHDVEKKILKARTSELLTSVGLYERRRDNVKTYSGGMKRRLNLIASLLHDPPILLCDEPTVGVDPQSRNAIFDYLAQLNATGKTIIYTTHYMEEAERLCSRIAIIDKGTIITLGSLSDIFNNYPTSEKILIEKNPTTIHHADLFNTLGTLEIQSDLFVLNPRRNLPLSAFFLKIEEHGIDPKFIKLSRPTLEDIFLHVTGRSLRD
jgi:ABC-2 type transport system ATP-binding protein